MNRPRGCQPPSASWLSPCRRGSETPTTTAPSGADEDGAAHAGHPAAATTGLNPARPPAPARTLPATRLRRHTQPRASAPQRELPTICPRMRVVERSRSPPTNRHPQGDRIGALHCSCRRCGDTRSGLCGPAIAQAGADLPGSRLDGSNLALEVCSISLLAIGKLPLVAPLTG